MQDELKKSDFKVTVYLKKFEAGSAYTSKTTPPSFPTNSTASRKRIEKAKTYDDFTNSAATSPTNEGEAWGSPFTVFFLKNSGSRKLAADTLERTDDTDLLCRPFQPQTDNGNEQNPAADTRRGTGAADVSRKHP